MLFSYRPLERILKLIGWLYKIEADNKGLAAEELKKVREKSSARILVMMKRYIEMKISNYAPKEAPRKAMQYILNHWGELSAYPKILNSLIDNNIAYPNFWISGWSKAPMSLQPTVHPVNHRCYHTANCCSSFRVSR